MRIYFSTRWKNGNLNSGITPHTFESCCSYTFSFSLFALNLASWDCFCWSRGPCKWAGRQAGKRERRLLSLWFFQFIGFDVSFCFGIYFQKITFSFSQSSRAWIKFDPFCKGWDKSRWMKRLPYQRKGKKDREPDRIFHNFIGPKSGDQQNLYSSGTSYDWFWSFKVVKGLVVIKKKKKTYLHLLVFEWISIKKYIDLSRGFCNINIVLIQTFHTYL